MERPEASSSAPTPNPNAARASGALRIAMRMSLMIACLLQGDHDPASPDGGTADFRESVPRSARALPDGTKVLDLGNPHFQSFALLFDSPAPSCFQQENIAQSIACVFERGTAATGPQILLGNGKKYSIGNANFLTGKMSSQLRNIVKENETLVFHGQWIQGSVTVSFDDVARVLQDLQKNEDSLTVEEVPYDLQIGNCQPFATSSTLTFERITDDEPAWNPLTLARSDEP